MDGVATKAIRDATSCQQTRKFGCATPSTKNRLHNPSQNEKQIRKMTNLGIALVSLLALPLLLGMVTGTTANPAFILDNGTLLGVGYNPAISEQDISDLQSFEKWCGKKHSIVVIFQGFSPDEQASFPSTQLDNIWHNGNTPLLTWEPWGTDDIPDVINNGSLDTYFEGYAQELYIWTQENWTVNCETGTRKQLFIRFAHEMNLHDEAYPWSNKTPASYKNGLLL